MAEETPAAELLGLTAEIVAAHVSNNPVALADLTNLIQEVYRTLASVGQPAVEAATGSPTTSGADQEIDHARIPDLPGGRKKLKMLKRHLQTSYGMTPEQYQGTLGPRL